MLKLLRRLDIFFICSLYTTSAVAIHNGDKSIDSGVVYIRPSQERTGSVSPATGTFIGHRCVVTANHPFDAIPPDRGDLTTIYLPSEKGEWCGANDENPDIKCKSERARRIARLPNYPAVGRDPMPCYDGGLRDWITYLSTTTCSEDLALIYVGRGSKGFEPGRSIKDDYSSWTLNFNKVPGDSFNGVRSRVFGYGGNYCGLNLNFHSTGTQRVGNFSVYGSSFPTTRVSWPDHSRRGWDTSVSAWGDMVPIGPPNQFPIMIEPHPPGNPTNSYLYQYGTCQGDSGGPLEYPKGDRKLIGALQGIGGYRGTSYVTGYNKSVFTAVAPYKPWFDTQIDKFCTPWHDFGIIVRDTRFPPIDVTGIATTEKVTNIEAIRCMNDGESNIFNDCSTYVPRTGDAGWTPALEKNRKIVMGTKGQLVLTAKDVTNKKGETFKFVGWDCPCEGRIGNDLYKNPVCKILLKEEGEVREETEVVDGKEITRYFKLDTETTGANKCIVEYCDASQNASSKRCEPPAGGIAPGP